MNNDTIAITVAAFLFACWLAVKMKDAATSFTLFLIETGLTEA